MTLASNLISRVRTNINEPSSIPKPQRSDAEILQWINDASIDYVSKVSAENFPELQRSTTFSGTAVGLPADYKYFHSCVVNRTISGTYTGVEQCYVVPTGESYYINSMPVGLGAYCQISRSRIDVGPNAISGTLSYFAMPALLTTTSETFALDREHEEPIVNKATTLALLKINDADSDRFMSLNADAVQAKNGRQESEDIERA